MAEKVSEKSLKTARKAYTMGNYANSCIMMHTTDTVLFRLLFLIMTKISGEKVKRRDGQKDRFGDKLIKFFPIFI